MEELLAKLKESNGTIKIDNGNLRVEFPKGVEVGNIIAEIKSNKTELLAFISKMEAQVNTYDSIQKATPKDLYVLSSTQKRLYFLYEFDKESLAYNMPQMVEIKGPLDQDKLEKAFEQLIVRHESLRTSFELSEREVFQRINSTVDFKLAKYSCDEAEVPSIINQFIRPFNLNQSPLIRVGVINISASVHVLMLDMHHIISDGVSQGILIQDFMALYNQTDLGDVVLQYKDYSEWQQGRDQQAKLVAQREFWLEEFADELNVINLPTDFPRPVMKSQLGDNLSFQINEEETAILRDLTVQTGSTMFMTILSIFNVLLSKISNQEDITIGTPVSGRDNEDLEGIIGMFVNTVTLRNYPKGSLSFKSFLSQVQQTSLACFDNQSYQYEELIEELDIARNTSRNPLFDILFVFQNLEHEELQIPGLELKPYDSGHNISKFDITLTAAESTKELRLNFQYSTALFKASTIARFVDYFKRIVSAITTDATRKLAEIDILSPDERSQLIVEFAGRTVQFPTNKTLIELFEERVKSHPDQVALLFEEKKLSYRELNSRANQLAYYLVDHGVKKGTIVGLMLERSVEMIVAIIATMKSGGAYLPMDTSEPTSRVQHKLKESQAILLITDQDSTELQKSGVKVISPLDEGIDSKDNKNLELASDPDQLAYIMYTSGSTGHPKGVMVTHKPVINLIYSQIDKFKLNENERILQFTTISFDPSVEQIWLALLSGSSLVLITKDTIADGEKFNQYIANHRVTHLHATPSFIDSIDLVEGTSVKRIVSAGEECNIQLAERYGNKYDFYNKYGPTETTISSIIYQYEKGQLEGPIVPIGKPISNTDIYILGAHRELLPIGVCGELYIGGEGLSQGYIGNEALTIEKFINSPFKEGSKIYKTGDLARWRHDGNIEYLGRADDQVKIRGFRIEPGEIQNQLASHPKIDAVVIAVKVKENTKHLMAYYTSQVKAPQTDFREYLSGLIPDYMIPSQYVQLDNIPLNKNGKVDYNALPDPLLTSVNNYIAPRTTEEKVLCEVWSKVLSIETIGVKDNFFSVGGDSIKSIQISSRVRTAGYELSVKDIFTSQTIEELALQLTEIKTISDQSVVVGEVPLTGTQRRFFASSMQAKHHYNQSVMMNFEDGITEEEVKEIFGQLQRHHDALRMVYHNDGTNVIQESRDIDHSLSVTIEDLTKVDSPQEHLLQICNDLQSSIDLASGPLMQLGLFHMNDGSRLLIVIHHLVIDGISWRILFEDIEILYQQLKTKQSFQLPLKSDSFLHWSQQLQQYVKTPSYKNAVNYWNLELNKDLVNIRRDEVNGSNTSKDTIAAGFNLSKSTTQKLLKEVHESFNTQINDILLAALLISVNENFGEGGLKLNMEGHGRENIIDGVDISRTVGWFTSVYPVILAHNGNDLSSSLIKTVKESLRSIPNNGVDYLIGRYLAPNSSLAIHSTDASKISFNYLGQFDSDTEGNSFAIAKESTGDPSSLDENRIHDWDISGLISGGQLSMSLSYSNQQYNKETISKLMGSYKNHLVKLIDYCSDYGKTELTPSDLSYKDLTISQLDELQKGYLLEDVYPLSPMQEGMLFHSLLDGQADHYFIQISYRLQGELDVPSMKRGLQSLVDRYDILRTVFIHEGYDRLLQVVLKGRDIAFSYHDIRGEVQASSREKVLTRYRQADKSQKFNLSKDGLIRVTVFRTDAEDYEFIWSNHHILMDGWCLSIIINEFGALYRAYKRGAEIHLPKIQPYSNYIGWLENRDKKISNDYWMGYLEGYTKLATLPKRAYEAPPSKVSKISTTLSVSKSDTAALNKLTRTHGITLNTIFQSIWGILLSRYNNTHDVVFGAVVSGRPPEVRGIEAMVGLFINAIPVRINLASGQYISDLLKSVQERAIASELHHYNPLSEIQSSSDLGNDLLDHIMIFENYPIAEEVEGGDSEDDGSGSYVVTEVESFEQTNYHLSVVVMPGEELKVRLDYNPASYDSSTIASIRLHLERIIAQVIKGVDFPISSIEIMSPSEEKKLTHEFNSTALDFPHEETVIDLFENQVKNQPQQDALIYEGIRKGYFEFSRSVNQTANHLVAQGIGKGDVVGVMSGLTIDLMVYVYAIMKVRAVYLPLDKTYPEERIKYIIADSETKTVICQTEDQHILDSKINCLFLNTPVEDYAEEFLGDSLHQEDLAYIIYTSGSTGRPKGVKISHGALYNYIAWARQTYVGEEVSPMALYTSISFDLTITSMFLPLISGNELYIYGSDTPELIIQQVLTDNFANLIKLTPSHLKLLVEANVDFSNVSRLIVGGEAFDVELASKVHELTNGNVELYNEYGPTEATVGCVLYKYITEHKFLGKSLPIGKPIANTGIYILNNEKRIQPIGVPGELCIDGASLSQGYMNNDELTNEKFVDHPIKKGDRVYKTGDLARWLPDGNIEFLGRIDDQVKIRGFRIELGEIESQLREFSSIKDAIVRVVEKNEDRHLVGYYISIHDIDPSELRTHLSEKLPEYMVPMYFVRLEQIPLTINGKVDHKNLPEPTAATREDEGIPSNEIEEKLISIWSEVLELSAEQIGVNTSFFQLGGHSLTAITAIVQINAQINVELSLTDVFDYPTIKELAAVIDDLEETIHVEIEPVSKKPFYTLSSAQRRMHFLYEFDKSSLTYNMPEVVQLEGLLDHDRLENAFKKLILRHESLRTSFELVNEEVVQLIGDLPAFCIENYESSLEKVQSIIGEFIRPFDLNKAPLLRVGLIKVSSDLHLLMADMHHIITDGVSHGILIKDFMAFYNGEDLPEITLQYKDYSEWQQGAQQQERLASQREFWLSEFEDEVTALDLPTDFVRPGLKNQSGSNVGFSINAVETAGLKNLGEQVGATMYMTVLSVFNVLLSKLSNQEDITIGTPVAGRDHAGLEEIIGMFVNTLALRNYPKGEQSFESFLLEVKTKSLACFDNQSYQYEELIEELNIPRDTSRNPLFDVMFNFQNINEGEGLKISDLALKPHDSGHIVAKFDLTLNAVESSDQLFLNINYSTDLFSAATIERFANYFKRIVSAVIKKATIKLSDIDILSSKEKGQLLVEFNDTAYDYPQDKTIIELFENQAIRTPNKKALIYGEFSLTYDELHKRADEIAHVLRQNTVKPQECIGLFADKSLHAIVGILGILKSGAAYLPLDTNYPAERISFMLKDSKARLILTNTALPEEIEKEYVVFDIASSGHDESLVTNITDKGNPEDLAYVMYTSGSTGTPKGVMVTNTSVVNFCYSLNRMFKNGFNSEDNFLSITNLSFDVSVGEIFTPLIFGSTLTLAENEVKYSPELFAKLILNNQISFAYVPPLMLNLVRKELENMDGQIRLNKMLVGVEPIHTDVLRAYTKLNDEMEIINGYGPTETTICATFFGFTKKTKNGIVPIGQPLSNTNILILDQYLGLQAIGVPGELCIGGKALSLGYLNNEQLTAEKFVENPYHKGELIYKTGDLARWLPDGNIEFLGRIDNQVKVRGFRIELGEIESKLNSHLEIQETVVLAREQDAEKFLVGYYVSEKELNSDLLRSFLSEQLPDYMLPDHYIHMESLPLARNGKIDRKALPVPEVLGEENYVGPSNRIEEKLVKIWSEVLNIDQDKISVERSFFELGGHSLKATSMTHKITKDFEIEIPLVEIFKQRTIKHLSDYIIVSKQIEIDLDHDESVEITL